jgi:1-acyl-sn-glycerol-3-phosphate acyltransferase
MRGSAALRAAARAVYGAYAWLALLVVVCPLCAGLAVLPGLGRRRLAARWAARLFFFVIGSPVRQAGGEMPAGPCVVVANHSSYLDGLILTAVLPPHFTFLIKREMERVPLAGYLLRRLGSSFVVRADPRQRQETVRHLVAAARGGNALALFPEGTFGPEPQLKPFQLGAFGAAVRAGLPVVPAVIFGSRAKLPSGRLLASPGALAVHICESLEPKRHVTARALMQAARGRIL